MGFRSQARLSIEHRVLQLDASECNIMSHLHFFNRWSKSILDTLCSTTKHTYARKCLQCILMGASAYQSMQYMPMHADACACVSMHATSWQCMSIHASAFQLTPTHSFPDISCLRREGFIEIRSNRLLVPGPTVRSCLLQLVWKRFVGRSIAGTRSGSRFSI